MRKLICRLIGHDWFNLAPKDVTPYLECRRCKKTGWLLP